MRREIIKSGIQAVLVGFAVGIVSGERDAAIAAVALITAIKLEGGRP